MKVMEQILHIFINYKFPQNPKILLITGDITNAAEQREFNIAEKYIRLFSKELNIDPTHILLIPGDHDIHRETIKFAMRKPENENKEGFQLSEDKYMNFSCFLYNKIYNKKFEYNKIIFDIKEVGKKIIILCVNSNYKVGEKSAFGYIDIEKCENEISEVKKKYPDKHILLAFHHNISGIYEDKLSGQWDVANRANLIHWLERNQVKCIFYGNEHTCRSSKLDSTEIYISDAGSGSSKAPLSTFKCYEIEETNTSIKIINHLFSLLQSNATTEAGYGDWTEIIPPSNKKEEKDSFLIYTQKDIVVDDRFEQLPNSSSTESQTVNLEKVEKKDSLIYYNNTYSDRLYEIIKSKKIFYSGHFHWSETSRALNWIDTSKILEDKENLLFAKDAIIDIISNFKLSENCDLIIGLGYEGNMISTKASIKYNIPYTFLPYSYRYDDHNRFETRLNFSNENEAFKTVLIITDVVNEGRTIRKLIGKREKSFFEKVEKIIVVSLIYTGKEETFNTQILNYNNLPSNYDLENDNEVNNIEYFSVLRLKVGKCPYKNAYREECPIYKDKLNYIHCFYEEKKK